MARLFRLSQLARESGLSVETLRRAIDARELTATRGAGKTSPWRVSREHFEAYLARFERRAIGAV